MLTIRQLLALADAYAHHHGISEARVSTLVFNDGKRLGALRLGESDVGVRRIGRAFAWFAAHWPAAAAWPANVPHPDLIDRSPLPPAAVPPPGAADPAGGGAPSLPPPPAFSPTEDA